MQPTDQVDDPWYEVVAGPALEQADILPRCPIPIIQGTMPSDPEAATHVQLTANVQVFDVIVLSQTCDIVRQVDGRRRVEWIVRSGRPRDL